MCKTDPFKRVAAQREVGDAINKMFETMWGIVFGTEIELKKDGRLRCRTLRRGLGLPDLPSATRTSLRASRSSEPPPNPSSSHTRLERSL